MTHHIRIESDGNELTVILPDGQTILPDVLTIRLEPGRKTRIKVEMKDKEPEYRKCNRFYANGGR